MRVLAAAVVYFVVLMQQAEAAEGLDLDLTLPRELKAGETVFVELQLGLLSRGHELEVTTVAGRQLGVISPFGVRTGQQAGTFTLPVPPDVFVNGHVRLRLLLNQHLEKHRTPSAAQVKSVRVKIAPAAR